jgi:dihydroflavonol-4-reductase
LDVEIVEGDLSDTGLLSEAIRGCDAVIHSAAVIHIGWKRLEESRQVNVEGTRRVVQACQQHHAKLIYVSTVDTLPAATSIQTPIDESKQGGVAKTPCTYVISKCEAEQVVRDSISQSQLEAVIIHPGFMLAPYDWKPSSGRMMIEVSKAPLALAPSGGCSVCDARDVAHGIVEAISRGRSGESYILAGQNMSYRELWQQMVSVAGKRKRVSSPTRLLNVVAKVLDVSMRVLPIREGDINGAAIAMGQLYHYYSSEKAKQELGYCPRPLSQTLEEAWQWLVEHHLS